MHEAMHQTKPDQWTVFWDCQDCFGRQILTSFYTCKNLDNTDQYKHNFLQKMQKVYAANDLKSVEQDVCDLDIITQRQEMFHTPAERILLKYLGHSAFTFDPSKDVAYSIKQDLVFSVPVKKHIYAFYPAHLKIHYLGTPLCGPNCVHECKFDNFSREFLTLQTDGPHTCPIPKYVDVTVARKK